MAKEQRRKRRKFSDEYKAETVRLIQSSGKSVGQMALELDIGETALRRWMAQAEVEAGRGPEGRGPAASARSWPSCGARISDCGWSAKS